MVVVVGETWHENVRHMLAAALPYVPPITPVLEADVVESHAVIWFVFAVTVTWQMSVHVPGGSVFEETLCGVVATSVTFAAAKDVPIEQKSRAVGALHHATDEWVRPVVVSRARTQVAFLPEPVVVSPEVT